MPDPTKVSTAMADIVTPYERGRIGVFRGFRTEIRRVRIPCCERWRDAYAYVSMNEPSVVGPVTAGYRSRAPVHDAPAAGSHGLALTPSRIGGLLLFRRQSWVPGSPS